MKYLMIIGFAIISINGIIWIYSNEITQNYMNSQLWWIDAIGVLLLVIGSYVYVKQREYDY